MAKEVFHIDRMRKLHSQSLIRLISMNVTKDTIGSWCLITLLNVLYNIPPMVHAFIIKRVLTHR